MAQQTCSVFVHNKPHYTLKIKILDNNDALTKMYVDKIINFNNKKNNSVHQDSGFDLFSKEDQTFAGRSVMNKVGLGVACAVERNDYPSGYYLYPRSSISKTGLRLANSVGIIDSGYRGELMAVVDNVFERTWTVKQGERLFQVCTPDLTPFSSVVIVDDLDDTERGAGGFGSTGK